jgi:hypothetical protein
MRIAEYLQDILDQEYLRPICDCRRETLNLPLDTDHAAPDPVVIEASNLIMKKTETLII